MQSQIKYIPIHVLQLLRRCYLLGSVALLALNRTHDFHQTRDELLLSGDRAAKEWFARLRESDADTCKCRRCRCTVVTHRDEMEHSFTHRSHGVAEAQQHGLEHAVNASVARACRLVDALGCEVPREEVGQHGVLAGATNQERRQVTLEGTIC